MMELCWKLGLGIRILTTSMAQSISYTELLYFRSWLPFKRRP